MSFSQVVRIVRDCELRHTQSSAVCNIAAVYDYGQKQADGKRPSQWVELALWGKQAEGLAQYLTKGSMIFVTARDLHVETFVKGDGTTSSKLVGTVVDIKLLPGNKPQTPPPQRHQRDNFDDFDNSIPF